MTDGVGAIAQRGLSLRVFPFTLSAYGSAAIDGVLDPNEWAHASCHDVELNLPEGGTTTGHFCAMNDSQNLYVSLRYARNVLDYASLGLEFDNDNDGRSENGDDAFLVNSQLGFIDDFRTNQPPCPPGSAEATCAPGDIDAGGTVDGAGVFAYDGSEVVYEMSHPLDSGDAGRDFALHPGDAVGFWGFARMIANSQFGDTDFPGPFQYARIITAATAPLTPPGDNVVVRPADPSTGAAPITIAFDEVTQGGTTGAYSTGTAPWLPPNFTLGNPPVAFEVYSTATFTDATVCIQDPGVTAATRMFHYVGGQPVDVTILPVDAVNHVICGRVTSFSPIALASEIPVPPLTITVPDSIFAEATGNLSAMVNFAATSSGGVAPVTVTCSPPSGTVFQLGSTVVTCTATDAVGATVSKTFVVAVVDTTRPVISCPAPITLFTSTATATLTTGPTWADAADPNPIATCSPALGSALPIGTTQVTCIAQDSSGHATSCSFPVTVVSVSQPLNDLVTLTQALGLPAGTVTSLVAKLRDALAAAAAGDTATACAKVRDFINEVNAQTQPPRNKKLTPDEARQLLSAANQIKSTLGCP
ncbi:MAG TPA: HYR domain-containing protein [Vicinamibacterales bacterium]